MNTLEMIKNWQNSNYKKKYSTHRNGDNLPVIVSNNGFNSLYHSYFVTTADDSIQRSRPFTINKENLDWEWEEIITEYDIKEAIFKTEQGDKMISLISGKILNINNSFSKDEIIGMWIQI